MTTATRVLHLVESPGRRPAGSAAPSEASLLAGLPAVRPEDRVLLLADPLGGAAAAGASAPVETIAPPLGRPILAWPRVRAAVRLWETIEVRSTSIETLRVALAATGRRTTHTVSLTSGRLPPRIPPSATSRVQRWTVFDERDADALVSRGVAPDRITTAPLPALHPHPPPDREPATDELSVALLTEHARAGDASRLIFALGVLVLLGYRVRAVFRSGTPHLERARRQARELGPLTRIVLVEGPMSPVFHAFDAAVAPNPDPDDARAGSAIMVRAAREAGVPVVVEDDPAAGQAGLHRTAARLLEAITASRGADTTPGGAKTPAPTAPGVHAR